MGATSLASKLGKNLIINPSFDIWQRGSSLTSLTTGQYTADRYFLNSGGAGWSMDVVKETSDLPTNEGFIGTSAFKVTFGSVPGLREDCQLIHRIEGFNVRSMRKKNGYFKCYVKCSVTGFFTLAFMPSGADRGFFSRIEIPDTGWQEIKIPVDKLPTDEGTWNFENGIGLQIYMVLGGLATKETTIEDEWYTLSPVGVKNIAGQIQVQSNPGMVFLTTQWQFHEGIDEILFNELTRDFETELTLCQRYFEKSYNINVAPGGNGGATGRPGLIMCFSNNSIPHTNHYGDQVQYKTRKRADPSIVIYSYQGTPGRMGISSGADTSQPGSGSYNRDGEVGFTPMNGGGVTENTTANLWWFHYTADAEL